MVAKQNRSKGEEQIDQHLALSQRASILRPKPNPHESSSRLRPAARNNFRI